MLPHTPQSDGIELWFGHVHSKQPPATLKLNLGAQALQISPRWQPHHFGQKTLWIAREPLSGLAANQLYQVQLADSALAARFKTLPRQLPREGSDAFSILLGSCFSYRSDRAGEIGQLSQRIPIRDTPHIKMLCGDQVYLDIPIAERFPLDSDALRQRLLHKYRLNWNHGITPGSQGFGSFLQWGANLFTADDHEFWNNYPFPQAHIASTWSASRRRVLRQSTRELFAAFQADYAHPQGERTLRFMRIGTRGMPGALDILIIDSRWSRSETHLYNPDDLKVLSKHLRQLRNPAVVVVGQPLFETPQKRFARRWFDANTPDFEDYAILSDALLQAPHDVLLLGGDIHGGRVARARLGAKQLVEVVSSPLALVELGKHAKSKAHPSFPAHRPRTEVQTLYTLGEDNSTLLRFSQHQRAVAVDVAFYAIHSTQRSPRWRQRLLLY